MKLWERAESVPSGRWQPAFDEVTRFQRIRTNAISWAAVILCASALLAGTTTVAWARPLAAGGSITSLTASGGGTIDINSTVLAQDRIQNSNLYYELFAPSGAKIATHPTDLPAMNNGDTAGDGWSYSNPPETGDYTVTLCWSTGNSHNCDIASAATGFYSVPTLGWGLSTVALLMLAGFLYVRRREFGKVLE